MEKTDFKKILLKTAVGAIACDGHIDDKEKQALYNIEKESPYFFSENLKSLLENYLQECINDIDLFNNKLFDEIKNNQLSIVEQLTLLEISLRIIAADEIEEDAEKSFVIRLRNSIKLSDNMIKQRFGDIAYLEVSEFKSFNLLEDISEGKSKK
jgi:uncharacterized membrane protein YebE (DUF533 family)